MAISVSYNGATIYKPGAYSKTSIDLGGSFPLGQTGIVGIIGESSTGKPGKEEIDIGLNVYTPDRMIALREKYGTGSIVDAAAMLFAPASDGAIPSGAQAIFVYKTNASTRAAYTMASLYGKIVANEYGIGGNRISYKNTLISEVAPTITGLVISDFAVLASVEFDVYVNGQKYHLDVFTGLPTTFDTAVKVAALIQAAVPGIVVSTIGDTLLITTAVDALAYSRGYSKTIELADADAGVSLAKLGLTNQFKGSTVEAASTIRLNQKRDLIVESETLGGNIVLMVGCEKTGLLEATIQIDEDSIVLKEDAVVIATFSKSAYNTIGLLIEDINLVDGWNAKISSSLYSSLKPSVLDFVSLDCLSESGAYPVMIKKDAYEVKAFFEESQLCSLIAIDGVTPISNQGLPAAKGEVLLVGGVLGATTGADIVNALTKFEGIKVNFILPLFSRDAADDISDTLTDPSSTYTIDAIHQAVKSHLSITATTKSRSERQAVLSYKASWEDCKVRSADLADFRIQLAIQDTRNIDSLGNIKWFLPWSLACYITGARAGSPVGTPLTFKYMNCSGIRHTAQLMSTDEESIVSDFDPRTQYEEAIKSGIIFLENPQSGGYRIVVDNTTYNRDSNWVRNRGNVQYAADVLSYDFRNQVENIYVGVKNTISANEVKSVCQSILTTYLSQGITVSTGDAPSGFKDLTVAIDGNTIRISFVAKLVEGIDFVLSDITVSRASSVA